MKRYLTVSIPRCHPAVALSCVFMAGAAIIRLCYYLPRQMSPLIFWAHLVLPVAAAVVFLGGFALGGRWAKCGVLAAVAMGVVFFLIKAAGFTPVHRALCTLLYLAVLVLVFATLLGLLPTKKLLYPLFALPLAYHLLVEDTQKYFFARPPVPVTEWMPEMSVLCIMAALLSLSFALKTEKR